VARHAAAHAARVAVVDRDTTLTYGELDTQANQLAAVLVELGVRSESPVGVALERSAQLIVTMLAILKAGGNYVPLDPEYPTDRLARMLDASAATVVVTDSAQSLRLPVSAAATVVLDDLRDSLADRPAAAPAVRTHPDQLAYTMFTSGSTGTPKGVVVTHRGVVRLVHAPGYVRLDDTETLLHQSSTSFDAATFEIWGALTNGARLVVAPGKASVLGLGRLVREHEITTAFFTTGLFHLMVDERLDDLAGVRQLLTGGEVISPARATRLLATLPGCRLVNAYGPTEVTTFTTCEVVSVPEAGAVVPIGRPIKRTWVRLLDDNLECVPDGAVGQLYAGGDGLARGYLGDAALTAERFVPDPLRPGQRLYRTGDLARRLGDGRLEFLGRADQQIKRRGFRIEPGEIEAALRRDPDVRDAVVLPEGDTAEERRLVAYLTPARTASASHDLAAGVRKRLRDVLPSHLMPDRWLVLDELPLNANGKVDRRALAGEALAAAVSAAPVDHAESKVEAVLMQIWQEIFGVERVGRHDDFFDLGGHSLLASKMVSRIRTALGVEIALVDVFDHPTLTEIAELIDAA
jgi:amino acid adenylation domain-containing protein